MLGPPVLYSAYKDGTNEFVLPDPSIKGIDQQANVLYTTNIHAAKVRIGKA